VVQQPDFTETHAAMDGRLVADQEQGAVPFVAFSKSEIIMEKLLPEELADRVGRLERECLDLRQAKPHEAVRWPDRGCRGPNETMSGAQLVQRTEEVRAGSISVVDKGGFPRALLAVTPDPKDGAVLQLSHKGSRHPQIVLTVNRENQVALSLLDSDHRPRIFLGLEPDGSPRLRLQDKDGNSLFQAPMEPNPTLPSLLKP
jgi:hypothetical protein